MFVKKGAPLFDYSRISVAQEELLLAGAPWNACRPAPMSSFDWTPGLVERGRNSRCGTFPSRPSRY